MASGAGKADCWRGLGGGGFNFQRNQPVGAENDRIEVGWVVGGLTFDLYHSIVDQATYLPSLT